MTTTITMRHATNGASEPYLGFYNGSKLIGEVDPTDDGKFRVFHRLNLIGIHLEEHWAISHLQKAIAAGIPGTVKFALA